MTTQQTNIKPKMKTPNAKHCHEVTYSAATIAVAKMELQKSENQSDEAFLIRAEMDKKLSSL